MIYNEDIYQDIENILRFIETASLRISPDDPFKVDSHAIKCACIGMRLNFPYDGEESEASAFKKMANFIVFFMDHMPISYPLLPIVPIGGNGKVMGADWNAMIALSIAVTTLQLSVTHATDEEQHITEPIWLSEHSYCDVLTALAEDIKTNAHFKMLAIFLEQLVYKANPLAEYPSHVKHPNI